MNTPPLESLISAIRGQKILLDADPRADRVSCPRRRSGLRREIQKAAREAMTGRDNEAKDKNEVAELFDLNAAKEYLQ